MKGLGKLWGVLQVRGDTACPPAATGQSRGLTGRGAHRARHTRLKLDVEDCPWWALRG